MTGYQDVPRRRAVVAARTRGRMVVLRVIVFAALACALRGLAAAPGAAVRVWQDSMELPTYAERAPNPNPPFDLFSLTRFNYPYTLREALSDRPSPQRWRALHLENEYLRVTVLPDAGGHLYSCVDKVSGRDLFYANPSIKKALIGYRGAWAAFGIEFNFPVSHNWMSMSPVDFAARSSPDGSGSIWVGNTDAVYGSSWRVELRLRPGRSVLEQAVTLHNRADARHRYFWWTNAAVEVWDDSRLVYPTRFMATHGFTAIQPWPIDASGRDLSVIRNQTDGPVSLFTYGTREPFVAVYHPHTSTGTVHIASPAELPTHKVWSWGADAEAMDWRRALSDNGSAYVELQAGLFRNQETYGFLEPQETVRFTEYWLPVRAIGGITRATLDAVFHAERGDGGSRLLLGLNVTHDLANARVRVRQEDRPLLDAAVALSPRDDWRQTVDGLRGPAPWTFELLDASGRVLLAHTEGRYDVVPDAQVRVGPQPAYRYPPIDSRTAQDIVELGRDQELDGKRLAALATYREGLRRFGGSVELNKAAGRLATALHWPEAGALSGRDEASQPLRWLTTAHLRDTTDAETRYYLGLALSAAGRRDEARRHWEAAQRFRSTRAGSLLQLARLAARERDFPTAAEQLEALVSREPDASLAGALLVTCLRLAERSDAARAQLAHWQEVDPTSSLLEYEGIALKGATTDDRVWEHLAADPNRILDLYDQYAALGAWTDASALVDHAYPRVDEPMREPGVVPPSEHALLAYYRAFAHEQRGLAAKDDYRRASALSTAYVFPSRASTYAVLRAALRSNPDDATARFLLGSVYLSAGLVDDAIGEWERARALRPDIPTLHRNLGLALLLGKDDPEAARRVFLEGAADDPRNVEVYEGIDRVMSLQRAPAADRVAALRRYPAASDMPPALVFKLALALAEAGDAAAADALFRSRFFPREEGGTSVRTVFAQVRLRTALTASEQRRCPEALAVVDSLARETPDLAFTRGGLEDVLRPALMQRQLAAIESSCGRDADARRRLTNIVQGAGGGPLQVALAYEAAGKLGSADDAAWRPRLTDALAATRQIIEAGTSSSPGTLRLAEGLLLRALGREPEAARAFAGVFKLPDRNLSYCFARAALASRPEGR
jgi:tetratricopeptide (TPR) repeat protein